MKTSKQKQEQNQVSDESDSQTIEQSSYSYEHLINQIKIKSTALTKASNLIEILQVELQVEKSSRQEAIRVAQHKLQKKYEIQIADLHEQIRNLQESRSLPIVHSTELKRQNSRVLPRCDSRSLHRSRSKEGSICASNMGKKNRSKNQQSQLSIEVKMYRKWILEMLSCQTNIMQALEELKDEENEEIQNYLYSTEEQSSQFLQIIRDQFNVPQKTDKLIKKYEQLTQIIRSQNTLISNMSIYQKNLEQTITTINKKLCNFTQSTQQISYHKNIKRIPHHQTQYNIDKTIQRFSQLNQELSIKNQKLQKLQNQNGQLRCIIQEMIALMKKKKLMTEYE